MKKKVLPLAVGAASAVVMTAANAAMYVNEDGLGESLIFPFYSAENGNNTNINIANTTSQTKAVKVRIIEAKNSQEVLDFNLYMSPRDHFSFAIVAEGEGAKIITSDNSCTVPAIPEDGEMFRNTNYSTEKAAATETTAAYDHTGLDRTKVGYVEVIEMGQLDQDFDPSGKTGIDPAGKMNAHEAALHDSTGVPANCDLLVDAWSNIEGVDGTWQDESGGVDIAPTEFEAAWSGGGLYGYASVINVAEGAAFGYDAVAIADHVATPAIGGAMHYPPGTIDPNFKDSAFDTESLVFSGGAVVNFDATDTYAAALAPLQALNATIMATEVYNDYVTDDDIAATTDWLFTFPTKMFHTNGVDTAVEPFSEVWDVPTASACEPTSLTLVDREESAPPPPPAPGSSGPDFSPAPPTPPGPAPSNNDVPLCYEATIVQFAEESAAGTSTVAVGVNAYLDAADGWATVSFDPADIDSTLDPCNETGAAATTPACDRQIRDDEDVMTGLPVVGFAVQKYVNGELDGGVLANYAVASVHKTSVAISN